METLHKLEAQLEPLFKDLPELPKNAKDTLVSIWPYLALFLAIIQLAAAFTVWGAVTSTNRILEAANYLSASIGYGVVYSQTDKILLYVGIGFLIVNAAIFLMAYKPLSEKSKKGWDLLFLASVVNVAYGVLQIFLVGYGLPSFLMSLVGSAIGFYLLFQIKNNYTQKKTKTTKTK